MRCKEQNDYATVKYDPDGNELCEGVADDVGLVQGREDEVRMGVAEGGVDVPGRQGGEQLGLGECLDAACAGANKPASDAFSSFAVAT